MGGDWRVRTEHRPSGRLKKEGRIRFIRNYQQEEWVKKQKAKTFLRKSENFRAKERKRIKCSSKKKAVHFIIPTEKK